MHYKMYCRHTVICGTSGSLGLLRGLGHNLVGEAPANKLGDFSLTL